MEKTFIEKKIENVYTLKDIDNILSLSSIYPAENIVCKDNKPIVKRKKKVTIKKDIDVVNIEAWKKFNIDVSESGGCPEWDLHSMANYEDDIYEFENEICSIF